WEHELYRERTIWDPLEHWELAIRKMHSCVQQWNRIRSGSVATKDRQDFLIRINEEIVDHTVEVQIELCTRSPSGFRMSYVPRNLMGAMWVQFAQAIAENDDFRKCQACDRWFPITLGENRKSRLHCS